MTRLTRYSHDGLTFEVLDEGPEDGEVVVLLHGFPERASCWREVAPVLHAQGYRTLAPDQRGYSVGARPRRRRDYRTTLLAGDVAALVAAAREVAPGAADGVHLVGHDWGAIVAWVTALRHPALVRTLVAVSVPHPEAFLKALVTSRQFLRSWYMAMFQLPVLPERLGARRGGFFEAMLARTGMDADDLARFRSEIVDHGALPGGLAWYRALPFLDRSLIGARVTQPTTLVWSDGDDALDRAGVLRTEQHVEGPYELVILEGEDHWIPTHAPQPLAEAILVRVGARA
ncbi:alpha/beta fold hydrolase [Nocardioides sp.]|uniref:alpha/beta fold hydrolase n=1 Tax=Nocardioides sp. TaxID=35761 RepID=UPI003519CCC5